jgi:hypothetical protein
MHPPTSQTTTSSRTHPEQSQHQPGMYPPTSQTTTSSRTHPQHQSDVHPQTLYATFQASTSSRSDIQRPQHQPSRTQGLQEQSQHQPATSQAFTTSRSNNPQTLQRPSTSHAFTTSRSDDQQQKLKNSYMYKCTFRSNTSQNSTSASTQSQHQSDFHPQTLYATFQASTSSRSDMQQPLHQPSSQASTSSRSDMQRPQHQSSRTLQEQSQPSTSNAFNTSGHNQFEFLDENFLTSVCLDSTISDSDDDEDSKTIASTLTTKSAISSGSRKRTDKAIHLGHMNIQLNELNEFNCSRHRCELGGRCCQDVTIGEVCKARENFWKPEEKKGHLTSSKRAQRIFDLLKDAYRGGEKYRFRLEHDIKGKRECTEICERM